MAELPRYKSSGLQVAVPEGQFRDVSAPMDALSKGMNQMTSFFMQSAQEQAVVEGEKYGAENAPSLEQIANARKLNEPLKPVAEQFTYFGRAATETSNRILAKNISADADMALEKLSARISSGEIPINQITSQTNALIQGYSTVLKDINPALGRSVEADLALSGNRMFLAASKAAAAEALAEQQEKVAKAVETTLPSTVAQIFKTGTIEVAGGLTLTTETQLEIAKSKALNMINSLPPKQRKEMTKKLDGFIATAAGDSIDQSLVSGTLEELRGVSDNIKNGVYKTAIKDPGDQLTYLNKVKSQISSLETEGDRVKAGTRLSITQQLEDVNAALGAGKPLLLTDIPSKSSIMENFEGAQLQAVLESRNNLVDVYSSIADLGNKSAAQVNTMLKQLETELKTGPVIGSEASARRLQAVSAAVELRNKAIQADPALYVRGNFSEVRGAYENMFKDSTPENVRGYVTLATNAQLSLGIRPENVALLPKAQADDIVNGFNNQVASGLNYADYLTTLQDTWGAAFPQVLKQLGKDLPAQAGVVASVNLTNRNAAQILANAVKPDQLKALNESVPKDTTSTISDAVDIAMVPFRDSLFNSASLNGPVEYNKYNSAVNILALTYASRGDDPATATQKAYDQVIGTAYTFGDGFRIPMGVDQERIIKTTSIVLKNIGKFDNEIQSPVSILGFTPQQAKDQYVSSLVANGRWINTPDERFGLRLVDENGSPVLRKNGAFFEVDWTTLSTVYAQGVTTSPGKSAGSNVIVVPKLFP